MLFVGAGGNGGVHTKGDFRPIWKGLGLSIRCMWLALLGDSGGVVMLVFPASSRNRLEKSMEGDSMDMGVRRITFSKALGC